MKEIFEFAPYISVIILVLIVIKRFLSTPKVDRKDKNTIANATQTLKNQEKVMDNMKKKYPPQ